MSKICTSAAWPEQAWAPGLACPSVHTGPSVSKLSCLEGCACLRAGGGDAGSPRLSCRGQAQHKQGQGWPQQGQACCQQACVCLLSLVQAPGCSACTQMPCFYRTRCLLMLPPSSCAGTPLHEEPTTCQVTNCDAEPAAGCHVEAAACKGLPALERVQAWPAVDRARHARAWGVVSLLGGERDCTIGT